GLKVAAVGDKTAEAIAAWGIRADLVPSGEQSAAGLLEDWPPFDELLDAIKTGKFDAVVFTSSSTVRNLVGIAGKPHASTVIAAIGPATAKTCEEHGLRVDVLAPKPSVEAVVDALADFGASRRAAMLEAGQPVTKPSERRPSARRKAT